MILDLHVHTTRYSTCSRMMAEDMAAKAIDIGLDGLVITEHNAFWEDDEIADLRQQFPQLTILRGVEVSAAGGVDILVYGITQMHELEKDMPPEHVLAIAHQYGAFAVWAHPLRRNLSPEPALLELPFDGFECQSMNIDPSERSLHLDAAKRMGAAPLYNSDGHAVLALGVCATQFDGPINDEKALARALKKRAFQPLIQSHLFDPAWERQQEALSKRVRAAIGSGIADPVALRRKVGVLAMPHIEELTRAHKEETA